MYAGHTGLWDLSSSVGTPSMSERTVQELASPLSEFTRTPPSPQNPPILRIDLHIAEPWEPEPPPQFIPTQETSSNVLPATDSTVNNSPSSPPDPQVSAASADGPRSIPPSEVRQLTSSKIPSSRIGRLFHYGGKSPVCNSWTTDLIFFFVGLAASLGYGAASEIVRRSVSSEESSQSGGSLMLTESNVKRLVTKLTRMRGAALKIGQFLSIQGTLVGSPLAKI